MITKNKKLSDEELLRKIKNTGKTDSNETTMLVERYMNIVRIKALTTVKQYPYIEFDDLFSEGLMGLLKAIRYYNEEKGASFATFASLCVDTSIITCIKKVLKTSPTSKDEDYDFDSLQDNSKSADDIIIDKEEDGEFYKKLSAILTEREMSVLDMYLRHYTYQQIAEKLNIKEKSVDNALQRAKSKIKNNLGIKEKTGKQPAKKDKNES